MKLSDDVSVGHPGVKMVTAWMAAIGVQSWGDIAAICAAFYSLLLICEWFYRRFWRDKFVAWGWLQPVRRRRADQETDRMNPL